MAGITQPLHPHLFRHQMLTYLTSKGLTDAQIQLISGHESKKRLAPILHTLTRMTGLVVAKSLVRSDFRRIRGDDVLQQPVFQAP